MFFYGSSPEEWAMAMAKENSSSAEKGNSALSGPLATFGSMFGKPQGKGTESWRQQKIVSASHYERPLNVPLPPKVHDKVHDKIPTHEGVVVNTDKGNSYLIHHPQSSTCTVTPASNMSNKWTKTHDIPVKGQKTVQKVYNEAGGRTKNPFWNYITAGTCKGVAKNAEKALKK